MKSRRMRWAVHVALTGKLRDACWVLMGKLERRRLPGRPGRRWTHNCFIDPRELGLGGVDGIILAQGRDDWRALAKMEMNLRVPENVGKLFSSWATGGISERTRTHCVSSSLIPIT
jgi:hypothetical protein